MRHDVATALETTLANSRRIVRAVAAHYRLNADELDELAQEVRVRLWRALGATQHERVLNDAYIRQTATTAALDLLRRRRYSDRWVPIETVCGADLEDDSTTAHPARSIELDELTAKIGTALLQLPDDRRHAVRLYLMGYACAEIVEQTGWSEPRARNLLYRGLAQLRVRLAGTSD